MTTATNIHDPVPGQPAAMVVEHGVYLARFPFHVACEVVAFTAARRWLAAAVKRGEHADATVEEYDGKADVPAMMLTALKRALFISESPTMPAYVNGGGAVDAVRAAIAAAEAAA